MIKKIFLILLTLFLASNSFAGSASLNNNQNQVSDAVPADTGLNLKNKTSVNYYQIFKSVMFSTKDVDDISKTLPRFKYLSEFKQEDEDPQEALKRIDVKQKSIFNFGEGNIYIYLNSIMYASKNEWSIWVSGNKITNLTNEGDGDIKVLDISPYSVKLAWTFDLNQWEVINPNKLIPESNYTIKDNTVVLRFLLSPNQSFLPATNQIIEGRIKEAQTVNETIPLQPIDDRSKSRQEQPKTFDNLFF